MERKSRDDEAKGETPKQKGTGKRNAKVTPSNESDAVPKGGKLKLTEGVVQVSS